MTTTREIIEKLQEFERLHGVGCVTEIVINHNPNSDKDFTIEIEDSEGNDYEVIIDKTEDDGDWDELEDEIITGNHPFLEPWDI